MKAAALIVVASLAVLAACTAPAASAPASSAPSPSVETTPSATLADLDLLVQELERIHPEPYHGSPAKSLLLHWTTSRLGWGRYPRTSLSWS